MTTPNYGPSSRPTGTTLFRFNGVPVVAQPGFWPLVILVTSVLTWIAGRQNPGRSWPQRLGVGILALPVALLAEIGHAMAHTFSARMAEAPMDEILLSSGMPRTLYRNNAVPPQAHIQRSLGGPIFSLIGVMLSLLWWRNAPQGSTSHDLAAVSLVGHSWILFGCVTPLPMFDGGTILKWKLVEAGQSPTQTDATVRKTCLRLGASLLGLGGALSLLRTCRLVGGLLAAAGAAGVAAGVGRLK